MKQRFQLPPLQNSLKYSLTRFPTINKWISKSEFATAAHHANDLSSHPYTPVGGSHMEENGIHYPQMFRGNEKRPSWKTVLKDAGQLDGYRKIHADKKRREESDVCELITNYITYYYQYLL